MVRCQLRKHGDLGLIANTHVKITHWAKPTYLQSQPWGDGDGGSLGPMASWSSPVSEPCLKK